MNLREELYKRRLSQSEFARHIGKHRQQVSRWVLGHTKMTEETEKFLKEKLKEFFIKNGI